MIIKNSLYGNYFFNNRKNLVCKKHDSICKNNETDNNPKIDLDKFEVEVNYDSITKRYEEFVISNSYDVFNLFSNLIPVQLSYYVKKARVIDSDIFTVPICREGDHNFFEPATLKLTQTPLDYITMTLDLDKKEVLDSLEESVRNYNSFFTSLLNHDSSSMLKVVEKYTYNASKINHREFFKISDENRAKYECMLMTISGASLKCIRKATGLHHSTVEKMFKEFSGLNDTQVKTYNAQFKKTSKRVVIKKLMSHVRNSKQIMLMVAFYNMCARLILKKNNINDILSNYAMPQKISNILAVGAYSTVILLNEFLNHFFNVETAVTRTIEKQEPTFDEFMAVLDKINTNEAEVIRCPKCNTPYIFMKNIITEGDLVYEFRDPQPCPACGYSSELVEDKFDNSSKDSRLCFRISTLKKNSKLTT